jgi:hypothetical protein
MKYLQPSLPYRSLKLPQIIQILWNINTYTSIMQCETKAGYTKFRLKIPDLFSHVHHMYVNFCVNIFSLSLYKEQQQKC